VPHVFPSHSIACLKYVNSVSFVQTQWDGGGVSKEGIIVTELSQISAVVLYQARTVCKLCVLWREALCFAKFVVVYVSNKELTSWEC